MVDLWTMARSSECRVHRQLSWASQRHRHVSALFTDVGARLCFLGAANQGEFLLDTHTGVRHSFDLPRLRRCG